MELLESIRSNLLQPAPLFFLLGVLAALLRSDLKLPEALYASLTIYLLVAIGFKGGAALSALPLTGVLGSLALAFAFSAVAPLLAYPLLRRFGRLRAVDSASIAAHYGSVSAVTFTVASAFLTARAVTVPAEGAAWLAIMEAPAILTGVLLGKRLGETSPTEPGAGLSRSLAHALRDAVTGRSVVLLVGALVIGWVTGKRGLDVTAPLFVAPFQGVLVLFLLELGLVTGRRFKDVGQAGPFLIGFGVVFPLLQAGVGALAAHTLGLSVPAVALFATLCASASYIAAPAAMRLALPEANPSLALTAALAITFPFNVTLGIPLYYEFAQLLANGAAQ